MARPQTHCHVANSVDQQHGHFILHSGGGPAGGGPAGGVGMFIFQHNRSCLVTRRHLHKT